MVPWGWALFLALVIPELPDSIAERAHPIDPAKVLAGDFADLDAVGRAIGAARVVVLGEESHGDGAAFEAKVRLVEYLHREHGFRVVAFESDFFALARGWRKVEEAEDVGELARDALFRFWGRSEPMRPLWRYIGATVGTDDPLVLAGIDTRHHARYSKEHLVAELTSFLESVNPAVKTDDRFQTFVELVEGVLEQEFRHEVSGDDRRLFRRYIGGLRRFLAPRTDAESRFWRHELKNLEGAARHAWSEEYRDRFMAENVLWLAQEAYPEAKIIVWAHNSHAIERGLHDLTDHPLLRAFVEELPHRDLAAPMGEFLQRKLGDAVYTIGFASYEGRYSSAAWQGDFALIAEITSPSARTLEARLVARELDWGFVDLAGIGSQRFVMRGTHHTGPELEADWSEAYDGVFFIREMTALR